MTQQLKLKGLSIGPRDIKDALQLKYCHKLMNFIDITRGLGSDNSFLFSL